MKILPGAGIPSGYNPTSIHDTRSVDSVSSWQDVGRRFDQVSIAKKSDAVSFRTELETKLTQELQAATSAIKLSELHRQVQTGEYKPDPVAIARRLLMRED